jgi:hypothetical protein
VKEGSENDWKEGNPSNEDEPPPLLKEEEEVYDVVVRLFEVLPKSCDQLIESIVAI